MENAMKVYLKERIGNPNLFTGRKGELARYLQWIEEIKEEKSQSTAILARRKLGKSSFLERLFNLTFAKGQEVLSSSTPLEPVVVPFYYEVKETPIWIGEFSRNFLLAFLSQFYAFHSNTPAYLNLPIRSLDTAIQLYQKEGMDSIVDILRAFQEDYERENVDALWSTARELPHQMAYYTGRFVVQMIDEFQFLTDRIYWDKERSNFAREMAGGYLGIAESKIAPLLVTGSWVTWLRNSLSSLLPSRFRYDMRFLELPQEEAIEMIYKYSDFFKIPITEETVYSISQITGGDPHYINSIIRSACHEKDLQTQKGVAKVLDFETLDQGGKIFSSWMEYIGAVFGKNNGKTSKDIVLYLCKQKGKEVKRKDLLENLLQQQPDLDLDEEQLEKKLKTLVGADIIHQGQTNARYHAVQDNLFDKVFRGAFQEDIDDFSLEQIHKEHQALTKASQKEHFKQLGKWNYQNGLFAEFLILQCFQHKVTKKDQFYRSITQNLPQDFHFARYSSVWSYTASPEKGHNLQLDIFARAVEPDHYSVIGEVKNRNSKKFSLAEAKLFFEKMQQLQEKEQPPKAIGFVFSRKGFYKNAEDYLQKHQIAYTEDEQWLG